MKRRDFVVGAASAATLVLVERATAAAPCPPILNGVKGGQIACAASTLGDQANQLGAGDWLYSIPLPSEIGQFDISWQNRTAFWDDVHREIQFMGKAQNGGRAKHWIYSESNDAWRQPGIDVAPDKLGHIWMVTFDHSDDPGDYYYVEQDVQGSGSNDIRNTIRRMDRSVENGEGTANSPWGLLSRAEFAVWEHTDTPNPGIGYHPNLLGPAHPGIFCWGTTDFSYWDKLNDS